MCMTTDKNKARALACNGIETVIKVLNYHIDNINICKIGFGAFTNMIFDCMQHLVDNPFYDIINILL